VQSRQLQLDLEIKPLQFSSGRICDIKYKTEIKVNLLILFSQSSTYNSRKTV